MPINPVIGRIDVMVFGQSMMDRLANTYLQLEQRSQKAQAAVQAWDRAHGSAIKTATGFFGSLNNITDRMNRNIASMNQSSSSASRFSGSIVNLTKSMILFGTLLPLIHFPQAVIRSWQEAINVAGQWQDKMIAIRQIAGNMNDQEFKTMDQTLQRMTVQWGLNAQDMDEARKVMSTTNVVANDLGSTMDQTTKGLTLFNDVAQLSTAGSTTVANAWQTLATVADTLHLTVSQVPQAMDLVFETVKSGRNTIEDFNTAGARFLPLWQSVINSAPSGQQMSRLNELFTLYSQMSLAIGPQMAGTAMARVVRNIYSPNPEMLQVIQAARGRGIDLRPQNLNVMGPAAYLQTIGQTIGPQGPLVQQYIQVGLRRGTVRSGTEQQAASAYSETLMERIFGIRAVAGAEALGNIQQYQTIAGQRAEDLAVGSPVARAAMLRQQYDLPMAEQRREAAVNRLREGIGNDVLPMLTEANIKVASLLSDMVDTEQFQRADITGKVGLAAKALIDSFTNWYSTGGGRLSLQNAAYTIVRGIGEFIQGFVGGPQGQNIFGQVGRDIAGAIGAGVKDSLPGILGGVLTGGIGQGLLGAYIMRRSGFGLLPSIAGGAAFSNLEQGGAGFPGQLLGAAGMGLLGYGLLRRGGGALGRARVPLVGQTAGSMWGAFTDDAHQRGLFQAIVGLGGLRAIGGGIKDPATGRYMQTGLPGYERMIASGQTPRANMIRSGAKWGLSGLSIGLPLIQALGAPEDQKGRELAQVLGTVLGTVGGAFIPVLGQTGIGEIAGGAAGGWAGGQIYDRFFGRGGGTGLGPATDLPQNQQDFIQMMVMSLNLSDINTNLQQLLTVTSRGTVTPTIRPGSTTGAPAAQGTGAGLAASLTNQFGDTQLTKAQADAACGPAAATFFAKAYGRNPTLAEAYALQSQLQGGDIANLGGSNINALGQAINKLAGANVSEVYQGSNVDWGRLANNAQAGIPGIVNIGPSGNFPGHYFQIAGWNPGTNQFNVGVSGTALRGGAAQMTPEQMMAFGPALGAIYGTGAVPGTGGGDLHAVAKAAAIAAGIDPDIFGRQIQQESGFNPNARSPKGAMGIGQFMKGTFGAGVDWDPFDPTTSLTKAAQYDAQLIGKYGSFKNALWAYNAGEGNFNAGIMPVETKAYINSILGGSGAGPGGGGLDLGGGVTVNGPLIGQAILSSDEDIRITATKLVAELRRVARGGTASQHEQIKP